MGYSNYLIFPEVGSCPKQSLLLYVDSNWQWQTSTMLQMTCDQEIDTQWAWTFMLVQSFCVKVGKRKPSQELILLNILTHQCVHRARSKNHLKSCLSPHTQPVQVDRRFKAGAVKTKTQSRKTDHNSLWVLSIHATVFLFDPLLFSILITEALIIHLSKIATFIFLNRNMTVEINKYCMHKQPNNSFL